ncbi:unnamed protein product [Cuscuta epithymum]|uniref:Pectin acetylesterase n=1 Tax=Cuscuta epithymum TaxID=186058 RepID=A0AAV0FPU1_9ASTE|nr:unnamed protein product [Cuscuta epithymum]CAH9137242.1 unnamed protein product [Cuscuta epithymum]
MATIASRLDQLFLILFALLLPLSFSVNASLAEGGRKAEVSGNDTLVYPTFVTIDDGAVCLSGKPASYYFLPGYGDGLRNWLLFHNGGGWCKNISDCRTYIHRKGLDNDAVPIAFRDDTIFSNNSDKNPGNDQICNDTGQISVADAGFATKVVGSTKNSGWRPAE